MGKATRVPTKLEAKGARRGTSCTPNTPRVPGTSSSAWGHTIIVAKSKQYQQNYGDIGFQFERLVTGERLEGPHDVRKHEHLTRRTIVPGNQCDRAPPVGLRSPWHNVNVLNESTVRQSVLLQTPAVHHTMWFETEHAKRLQTKKTSTELPKSRSLHVFCWFPLDPRSHRVHRGSPGWSEDSWNVLFAAEIDALDVDGVVEVKSGNPRNFAMKAPGMKVILDA